jgi:threonine dehydrogenase-like Zn-dependent dehydrogenase
LKAWRMYGFNDLRLDEIPIPEVKPGWVLIKVKMLQPSITEVTQLKGTSAAPMLKIIAERGPHLFGHEFCGEVVKVGEGVTDIKVGNRVFYWRRVPCGQCNLCKVGHEELCCKGGLVGLDIAGCMAEYVTLPAGAIAAVPDSITDSEATQMQPMVGIVSTVQVTGVEMGDSIVVLGQGSMGMNVTQVASVCGAGKVIAVDVRDDILEISKKSGADVTINATKEDPIKKVMEATNGIGADIVFECAGGNPQHGLSGVRTLTQALGMVRDQGKITQVAMLGAGATFETAPINMRGLIYRGLGPCKWDHLRFAINLVASKRVKLSPLVTHTLDGIEKVPEAFEITGNKAKYGAINPAQVIISR